MGAVNDRPVNIAKLIEAAQRAGVTLNVVDDDLELGVPDSKVRWLDKLRPHKAAIVAALTGEDASLPAHADNKRPAWQPFPVDVLPGVLGQFVAGVARSQSADPSMAALPLLAALAGAIGGSRRVLIKPDWSEPCILWCAVVAPSGSGKTPAAAPVLRAVRDRDAAAMKQNELLFAEFDEAKQAYDADRKAKRADAFAEKPQRPPALRYHVADITPEQLLSVLADNPRGVLLVRDELSGMLGGFGRYTAGKGAAERGKYLTLWSCDPLADDRKTAASAYVPRPHVSIFGGVQPDVLFRAVSDEDTAAGLPARFLFAWPPERSRRWSEWSVPQNLVEALADVFDRLYSLELVERPSRNGMHVELVALDVPLSTEARQAFRHWHEQTHQPLADDSHGAVRAAYAKLPAYLGRLSLVLHLARWACGEGVDPNMVDAESVRRGVVLVEWFRAEADRVYALRGETDEDRDRRRLVEWIELKGGAVSARGVQMGCRWLRERGAAEAALNDLASVGFGAWSVDPTATKQARTFRLSTVSTSTDSLGAREILESVDVDSADALPKAASTPSGADHAPMILPPPGGTIRL